MNRDSILRLGRWAVLALLLGAGCSKQAKLERHLTRGNAYFKARKYTQAEIEYRNALRLQPDHPTAIRNLGLVYYEQGRWPLALAALQAARDQATNDLEVRLKLGNSLLIASRFKEARAEAVFVLSQQPTNDDALILLADSSTGTNDVADARQRLENLRAQAATRPGFHVAWGMLCVRRQDYAQAEAAFREALKLDPQSSPAYMGLGAVYLLQNDLKQAGEAYRIAASLAPPSPRNVNYATFLRRTGDRQGAREWLEQTIKKAPDFIPASLQLAELELEDKRYEQCDALIKRVLGFDPANYEALMLAGRLHLVQGRGTNALGEFERVDRLYPKTPEVQYHIALAHLVNGDTARALGALNQAITLAPHYADAVVLLAQLHLRRGDPDAAVLPLTNLLIRDPDNVRAQMLLANAHQARRDPGAAIAIYKKVAAAQPKNPEPVFFLGLAYLQQGSRGEARQAFEKAHALAPEMLGPIEQLVDLDIAEKQFTAAFQRVNALLDKNPKAPLLHALKAKIYGAQGDLKQAEAALRKAIELDPNFEAAHSMLARLYVRLRQPQKALEVFQAAADRNPKDVGALLQLGVLHHSLSNYTAARDTYEKVLALRPNSALALNNLATLYCDQFQQLDRAYELARRARELDDQSADIADTLGWVLCKRGEYSRALPLLREAASKLTDNPEVLYHLGLVHYMLGQEQPARTALQQALETNRDFPGKTDAQRRLAVLAIDTKAPSPSLIAELEKRLADQPDDPILLGRLGSACEATGATNRAIAAYERAIKQTPRNPPALVALARLYSAQGDLKKAVATARNARELAPADPSVAHMLGRLVYRDGDHKWALALFQEAAAQRANDPEVLYDLAWAYLAMGALTNAYTTMQTVVQTLKTGTGVQPAHQFVRLVEALIQPNTAPAAAAEVRQVLQADPTHLPALAVSGLLHEQQNNFKAAQQVYEFILARYPNFTPANLRLALLFAGPLADDQKAQDHGAKARVAYPNDAELARALGLVAYRRADYTRAVTLLNQSALKRTNDAELFFYLGMAHLQLKQTKQSKQALTQALALAPNAKFAAEAKQALAKLQ
jgi:tetratricopeptide (TPR) repeat protein